MPKVNLFSALLVVSTTLSAFSATTCSAETQQVALERAKGEQLATAVGHYSRARSLLIAAINEFDQGLKLANPDSLIDSKEFRNSLIDRSEELERVLDPQPRATKTGIKFSADSRLIGAEAKK